MFPSLKDIADHLGLSQSTVSRVLNNKGRVSEETRKKILDYADELHYRPNHLGKSLRLQRSNTVGILLPDINNEFYSMLFKEIDLHLRRARLQPILFDTNEDLEREEEAVRYLQSAVVDGLIVATSGSEIYGKLPASMLRHIVFIDNRPKIETPYWFVGSENKRAAMTLTQHLIDNGHRTIATLVGPQKVSSARERLSGFETCLFENGLPLKSEWVIQTNFLYQDGYEKSQALLASGQRPSAIIAQNNVLAYAAIRAAQEMNLEVPTDVAVACFDHVDVYGFMHPEVTSVVQSIPDLAAASARKLIDAINGLDTNNAETIIPVQFRLGDTSGS